MANELRKGWLARVILNVRKDAKKPLWKIYQEIKNGN